MSCHLPKNQIAESSQQKVIQHLSSAEQKSLYSNAESTTENFQKLFLHEILSMMRELIWYIVYSSLMSRN